MLVAIHCFWVGLFLGGYALARRLAPGALRAGVLASFGLSFALAFAAFSAASIVGYLLEVPLTVMSAAYVLLVAWGIRDVIRDRPNRQSLKLHLGSRWGSRWSLVLAIPLILLVVFIVWSAGVFFPRGDAGIHLARIRILLDHGMQNWDPFLGPGTLFRVYHTNGWHPLLAVCAQVTRAEYAYVWLETAPWVLLWSASSVYALTWTVFRSTAASWVSVAAWLASAGHFDTAMYPNWLAPTWLFPAFLTLVISRSTRPSSTTWLSIAALFLALCQMHPLYAVFAALNAGVIAIVLGLWRNRAAIGIASSLVLLVPFLGVYQYVQRDESGALPDDPGHSSALSQMDDAEERRDEGGFLRHVDESRLVRIGESYGLDPAKLLGSSRPLAIVLPLVLYFRTRRRSILLLLVALLVPTLIQYVPWLLTGIGRVAGGLWIPLRIGGLVTEVHRVALVGSVYCLAEALLLRLRWIRSKPRGRLVLRIAVVVLLCLVSWTSEWERSLDRALHAHGFIEARRHRDSFRSRIPKFLKHRNQLSEALHPTTRVLSTETSAQRIVTMADVFVLSSDRSSPRLRGGEEFASALRVILHDDTEDARRAELLERYEITQAVFKRDEARRMKWLKRWTRRSEKAGVFSVYELTRPR